MTKASKQQSNPFSTGGGGVTFETRVQAAFTVIMLTDGVVPCLPPWPITKIKLQGRYAAFNTDDIVVFVKGPGPQNEAKLFTQIKHDISITGKNETFSEVIQAAWNDFNDSSLFRLGTDAFALVTGPLSTTDINHVRPLLEWARHSKDETEFLDKVNTANFSSESKRAKLSAFKTQLTKANGGKEIPDKQLWEFLKSFHLLGYDLDVDAGATQTLLESLIHQNSSENARLLWSRVVNAVQSANQNAGTIDFGTLPQDLIDAFNTVDVSSKAQDLRKLKEHGALILNGIKSTIGGIHIERAEAFLQLLEASENSSFVFVQGERGCGKSGLIKEFAKYMEGRAPIFCFRMEEFDKAHLDNVFSSLGLNSSISELEASFALMPKKFLLLESLEKLLELENRKAFTDLLEFLSKHEDWTVIATGRSYAYQQIAIHYLQPHDIDFQQLIVENFRDDEVKKLRDALAPLETLAANPSLSSLLRNPFIANWAYRLAKAGTQFSESDGEKQFREAVWRDIIAKEEERLNGLPLRRKQVFTDIAVQRAKKMVFGVPEAGFDSEITLKLENDDLVRRDVAKGLVSPAHDVLEDWALERHIENLYQANPDDLTSFLESVGHEPAMNRAFRLWLYQKLVYGEDIEDFITVVLKDKQVSQHWQDETMAAVLLGPEPYGFLEKLRVQLLEGDGAILKRFCFILRIACRVPDLSATGEARSSNYLFFKPYGKGWGAIIRFLLANKASLSKTFVPHVAAVLDEWSSSIRIDETLPAESREAGLLALHILDGLKDSYQDDSDRKKTVDAIIKTVPAIQIEFDQLIENDVLASYSNRRQQSYTRTLRKAALEDVSSVFLCKYVPNTVIKLAFHEWLVDDSKTKADRWGWHQKHVEECFGLRSNKFGFFPASGAKGPFQYLLRFRPKKGLDFLLKLFNITAEKYAHSDLDDASRYAAELAQHEVSSAEQIEICLSDGTAIKQYASWRLWAGYRGHSVTPYLLQSALMALENWLIALAEHAESSDHLEWIFDHILRNSNSVMPTAVLASVATGFPDKLGRAVLSLLRVPELYELDLSRRVREMGGQEANWFGMSYDPLRKLYAEERREAALRPWRKEDLEMLITRLQFSALREEALNAIDELRAKAPPETSWRFRFHRIDSRNWEAEVDSKNNRILFKPKSLEPDLEESQRQTQEETGLNSRFIRLGLWSAKTFDRESLDTEYFSSWQDALAETKSLCALLSEADTDHLARMHYSGIVKAVAVFLRDHSSELSKEDVSWCAEIVSQTIQAAKDSEDVTDRADKVDFNGFAAAASVLPILLDFSNDADYARAVKTQIVAAFTHENATVRMGIANGIREHLWQRDRDFAEKCLLESLKFARLFRELVQKRNHSRWALTPDKAELYAREEANALSAFRERLMCDETSPSGEKISEIGFRSYEVGCLLNACSMIPNGSLEPTHQEILLHMLTLFFENEKVREQHPSNQDRDDKIYYEFPLVMSQRFADYLIDVPESEMPFIIEKLKEGCDSAPGFINYLLTNIAVRAERTGRKELYWKIWGWLSKKVQAIAQEITHYNARVSQDDRRKLVRGMLHADLDWQKIDFENQDIALGKAHILEFVNNTGENPDVFESMASLMYYFPEIFLVPGLKILAKHQTTVGEVNLFSRVNTVFYLEVAIQRFLQLDESSTLSKEIHQACYTLLNALVDKASSKAYYLREQLVRSRRIL